MEHTVRELKIAAIAIGYELTTMAQMAARLASEYQRPVAKRDALIENALLEAELTHARCLIEFLTRRKSNGGYYIVSSDYLNDPAFELVEPTRAKASAYYTEICARLADLTWARAKVWEEGGPPTWLDTLADDVVAMFGLFATALNKRDGDLRDVFSATLSEARMECRRRPQWPADSTTSPSYTTTSTTTIQRSTFSDGR